jgi:NhaA family Na+:H+ antiporter
MQSRNTAPHTSSPLTDLYRSEAFPGVLLISCAALAIAVANSPWAETWQHFWHLPFAFTLGDATLSKSLAHWINDGLMVVFFFFIGLEIKHEVLDGQLQSLREAALPVAGAIGGMLVPAGIYTATVVWRGAPEAAAGWGIPMATDIAFALGVLAMLGSRVPAGLKVFLASLAIADDLGAVLVIAIFYTHEIAWPFLGLGAAVLAVSYATSRAGVRKTWPFVVYGLILWATFLQSGVHATIAGVALAFTIPARRHLDELEFTRRGRLLLDEFERLGKPDPLTHPEQLHVVQEIQQHATDVQAPLQRIAHGLHPLVSHLIVPVFALANAGVDVSSGLAEATRQPAAQGVFLGLLIGKPVGIMLACGLATRLFGSPLPDRVTWRHIHGASWLAGIGFTMSLFVSSLAFEDAPVAFASSKIATLAASLLAGGIGLGLLRRLPPVAGEATR